MLSLLKRVSRFGGRTRSYVMKCPVVAAPASSEHIQCDSDFIQVTRQIPVDSWNNELSWSLALRGSLVVALEDASLIQVYVDIHKPHITVQGRRNTILSPVQVLQTEGQFLPLKLVSGNYAYSMEATCPGETLYSSENTVLHIYKRRMGLTKRGGYGNESLSVSSVLVNQTSAFTWSENSGFVKLTIPTALIQRTKKCNEPEGKDLQQTFFRIDVVLTFKETNNKMVWTMENTSPCLDTSSPAVVTESYPSVTLNPRVTFAEERMTSFGPPPYAEATDLPLFSAVAPRKDPQLFSQTTEGFSNTFKPRVPSVSPWSTSSLETDILQVLNSTDSLLENRGKSQEQTAEMASTPTRVPAASVPGFLNALGLARFVPTTASYGTQVANEDSDAAPSSGLRVSSLGPKDALPVISTLPSNSPTQDRISTATGSNFSKLAHPSTSNYGKVGTLLM